MFSKLLIGLKVKIKSDHLYLYGLKKGQIGIIVRINSDPKIAPNIYIKFKNIKQELGFMVNEVKRVSK